MNISYQICNKTIMDTTDPSIKFDQNGISDHYHDFVNQVLPRWQFGAYGHVEFERNIEAIRKEGEGKEFDCLLGLSGGMDSSYMLHYVVKKLGLRPLVFHVDCGWNSELAVHNINVLVEKLNVDLYTHVINWDEMKDFQLALFKSGVPNLDIPQDHANLTTLYHFANKYRIKYILNGGNISTECVQYPMSWFYYGTDMRFINDIRKKFCSNFLETYPFSSVLFHRLYLRYLRGVKLFKPLNYISYVKSEAAAELEKEYGWRSYPQKHFESRFTKFYEGYWLPTRFGYDVRKVQFSSLILTNQMTRDDALERLKSPSYDLEKIDEEFKYIATKLGISVDELTKYLHMKKYYYWDYKNSEKLFKLGALFLNLIGVEKTKKRNK
ncbi:N-acetyl sugar amidotransferase [Polynucleobacter sp. AP-Feld-500C-C5]|uniref:N-acetyl sugar amidotransferase n=1 Tax=Polynucleobacter sp. AP-Feld-500C-C5 TaxID=2576924 RepID=UPI0021020DE9|nr:N-acetyl sugar amidotransferase [Polynucleobacter sp. AP-Feld-500C-C5]MBU3632898.1 N-acetyl sugar amidotransferase [Polynucleobacter sp. AP-Feld-500C-C5]